MGVGVGVGVGVTVGVGVGVGVAVGVGVGVTVGVGVGVTVGVGVGVGVTVGVGVGVAVGVGVGVAVGVGVGVGVGRVILKVNWHSGTGEPSSALGCDSGAVGATGVSWRSLETVKSITIPKKKLTRATTIKPQYFDNCLIKKCL